PAQGERSALRRTRVGVGGASDRVHAVRERPAPDVRLEGRARVPAAQRRALRGASLPGPPATATAAARTAAAPTQERARQLPDAGRGRCRDDSAPPRLAPRSEERRVGKECWYRMSSY